MSDPGQPPFTVFVFDMARTGEPDGEHPVSGFETLEAATAYAIARVRASAETVRCPVLAAPKSEPGAPPARMRAHEGPNHGPGGRSAR